MSDRVPASWVNKVFFDYEGTMFSSIPEETSNVGLMPPTCSYTLKKTNGGVDLCFEDTATWPEDFTLWVEKYAQRRLVASKITKKTWYLRVLSWKFLPNNLGVGSIVFYGSIGDVPFQIYCGDNIKDTRANPSSQTWDILNGSDLPPEMQVDADMFLAIELEVATIKKKEAISALEQFSINYGTKFEKWMEPYINTLNTTMEATHTNHKIAKKYSELAGKTFLLSPGEEFVFINSPEDSVFLDLDPTSQYTGEGSELVTILETQSEQAEGKILFTEAEVEISFTEFAIARARTNGCQEVESKPANGKSTLAEHQQTTRV